MNEVRNGMHIPFNMFQIVTSAVSKKASMEIFLQGNVFSAQEALRLGIVDEIVSDPIKIAIEKVTFGKESLKAYASIKKSLKNSTSSAMKQGQGTTKRELLNFHGVTSKL